MQFVKMGDNQIRTFPVLDEQGSCFPASLVLRLKHNDWIAKDADRKAQKLGKFQLWHRFRYDVPRFNKEFD